MKQRDIVQNRKSRLVSTRNQAKIINSLSIKRSKANICQTSPSKMQSNNHNRNLIIKTDSSQDYGLFDEQFAARPMIQVRFLTERRSGIDELIFLNTSLLERFFSPTHRIPLLLSDENPIFYYFF